MPFQFDPQAYGPRVALLLSEERIPPLGPGTPNDAMRAHLDALTADSLFSGSTPKDCSMAEACIAGLWLYHDFLDRSHTISQSISTTTGSYWHGIMHRREPDFGNSAYWFRRVGSHPIFPALARGANEIGLAANPLKQAAWLVEAVQWDPFKFIDSCEACYSTPGTDQMVCRRVSLLEWRLLFDYCCQEALG